jgi:hypothetical protein
MEFFGIKFTEKMVKYIGFLLCALVGIMVLGYVIKSIPLVGPMLNNVMPQPAKQLETQEPSVPQELGPQTQQPNQDTLGEEDNGPTGSEGGDVDNNLSDGQAPNVSEELINGRVNSDDSPNDYSNYASREFDLAQFNLNGAVEGN